MMQTDLKALLLEQNQRLTEILAVLREIAYQLAQPK